MGALFRCQQSEKKVGYIPLKNIFTSHLKLTLLSGEERVGEGFGKSLIG